MNIVFEDKFSKKLKKLKKRNPSLVENIRTSLHVFKFNPHHNSLRLHKLAGNWGDRYSIKIKMNFLLIFYYDEKGNAVFYNMGTHDEVYAKT